MKLIKFIFWFFLTFTIAYLMTDLKIGGKTIKQGIDQVIAGTVVGDYKDKVVQWITLHLNPKLGSPLSGGVNHPGEVYPNGEAAPVENISNHDAATLKKLIESNK